MVNLSELVMKLNTNQKKVKILKIIMIKLMIILMNNMNH